MVTKVKIPKLTENDEEQAITAWLKKKGEYVNKGDPLIELSTSKVAFELEAPRSGVLLATLAEVKSSLPAGYVVALIGDTIDSLPDVSASNRRLMETLTRKVQNVSLEKGKQAGAVTGALRATPAARRLAREHGTDLALVQAKYKVEVITENVLNKYLMEKK
ncbi:MAG: biotin/lipoyl-containing protein [bacterium]|jgi:pyruvate/2-oxoglutarate dehydrogenase complex dihydrolipoamide acyltransferase (E2) component